MAEIFLELEINPRYLPLAEQIKLIEGTRKATWADRHFFESVVGPALTDYFDEIAAPLLLFTKKELVHRQDTSVRQISLAEKKGWVALPYIRSDYVSVIDGRIVFLPVWKKTADNPTLPDRVCQIDFMFLDDWLYQSDFSAIYKQKNTTDTIGGSGLWAGEIPFLRKMYQLVLEIDPDCLIQIHPSDRQRERIYKKVFAGKNNIEFNQKSTKA